MTSRPIPDGLLPVDRPPLAMRRPKLGGGRPVMGRPQRSLNTQASHTAADSAGSLLGRVTVVPWYREERQRECP